MEPINTCLYCDVISRALRHARTYPVATQKGVADFISITMQVHTGIKVFLLRITNKVM